MDFLVDRHVDSEAVVEVTVVVTVETEVAVEMLAQATIELTVSRRLLITNNCDLYILFFVSTNCGFGPKGCFFMFFVVNFLRMIVCSTVWK